MGYVVFPDKNNVDSRVPKDHEKDLFITVFTDGSLCHKTGAYGTCFWIKAGNQNDPFIESTGGVIPKKENRKAHKVELIALYQAKRFILDNHVDVTGKVIVFQSDCIHALDKFDYAELKEAGAKFVKLKHVKAHTANKTNRTKVNAIVDQRARRMMKKVRGGEMIINQVEAQKAKAEIGEALAKFNQEIYDISKKNEVQVTLAWSYQEGKSVVLNGIIEQGEESVDLNSLCDEAQKVCDTLNKRLKEWSSERGLDANFSWSKKEGVVQLGVSSITVTIYSSEPDPDKVLEEFSKMSSEQHHIGSGLEETSAP